MARLILPILVRQAKARKTIYYSDLAKEIGLVNPRNLNYPLGNIGNELMQLDKKKKLNIPQIQFIVINKKTGIPGDGISDFIVGDKVYKTLSGSEKRRKKDSYLYEIYSFPMWDEVLDELGLIPSTPLGSSISLSDEAPSVFHGGGEGKEHKELKEYVAAHPSVIGIPANARVNIEYPLYSGDILDISFQNEQIWWGVEVKPKTSFELDVRRGIFQCIKYQAVMAAQVLATGVKTEIRVLLVLGAALPAQYLSLKHMFAIDVIENVG